MSTNREDLRQAFLAHRREHGQAASIKIIKGITGAEDLDSANEDQREELLEAFEAETTYTAPAAFTKQDGAINTTAIFAKWNAAGRRNRGSGP